MGLRQESQLSGSGGTSSVHRHNQVSDWTSALARLLTMLSLDATWRHKQLTKIKKRYSHNSRHVGGGKIAKLEPVLIDPTSL